MSYFPYDKDLKKKKARAIEVSSLETKKAPAVILGLFTFFLVKLKVNVGIFRVIGFSWRKQNNES